MLTARKLIAGPGGFDVSRLGQVTTAPADEGDSIGVAYVDANGRPDHESVVTLMWGPKKIAGSLPSVGDPCLIVDNATIDPYVPVWSPRG